MIKLLTFQIAEYLVIKNGDKSEMALFKVGYI